MIHYQTYQIKIIFQGKYLTTYHLSASNEDLQNKIWDENKEQQEVKTNDENQICLETTQEENAQNTESTNNSTEIQSLLD